MNPLNQLKDIHLPENVSIWPLAPVWYLFVFLCLLLIVFTLVWLKRRNKLKVQNSAISRIKSLEAGYRANGDSGLLLREISMVIRRYAMHKFGSQSASIIGQEWLEFLDKTGGNGQFSKGAGKILATGPYARNPNYNVKLLIDISINWLRKAGNERK